MFLGHLWRRLLAWLPFRSKSSARDCPPVPPPADPPPEEADPARADEALVRFYEKQRRKHDKFVTPQGELPERTPRPRAATQEIKPRTPPPAFEPGAETIPPKSNGMLIIDKHHEDQQEVLYKGEELLGEFNFRDTILQQLERYFFYIKRMKKRDADAYHLYRQVGASLLPYIATGAFRRGADDPVVPREHLPLPPKFNQLRPSFGCFAYGADPETEKYEKAGDHGKTTMWVPKFMYYHKFKMPPATIQPVGGGDVYTLTVWWDRPDTYTRNKHGSPQQIPIHISADGQTITPLKVIETRWTPLKGHVRHGPHSIPQRAWKFPKEYIEWSKENADDVEHFLTGVFLQSVNQVENSHLSMTRISATKGNMTAVFSVNILRTSYFFQDRDISVTENGTRKPIFHVVKPHVRKDGTAVRMHFRGLRDFTWAGYRVHISIPGLDHLDINDLDIGAVDAARVDDSRDSMSMEELGAFLAKQMRPVEPDQATRRK